MTRHDGGMRLRFLSCVLLLVVVAGCDANQREDQPKPSVTPKPALTTPAPDVERWRAQADAVENAFLRSASRVHESLRDKSTIDTAIDICKAIANYEGDAALIADVRQAAAENNPKARLSSKQAAGLARLTNERICPDLAP
jgi:hypothetical protein